LIGLDKLATDIETDKRRAVVQSGVPGSRERRTLAVDLPGFGASPPEEFEPSVEGYVARLARWFAEQGLGRPHVAGNSMGGGIALELARARLVASATAISPVGFGTLREVRYAQRSIRASRAIAARIRPFAPAIAASGVGRTALLGQMHGRPWRLTAAETVASLDAFVDAPWVEPALQAFGSYRFHDGDELRGVPVTVAWGTRDALLIPRQAARARRMLPWARHVALQGCGHLRFHDDPEAVAAVLLAGRSVDARQVVLEEHVAHELLAAVDADLLEDRLEVVLDGVR
jgi:pimeloyl-ACP methyl ester carboxylesterase